MAKQRPIFELEQELAADWAWIHHAHEESARRRVGFSTGALAKGDFERALIMLSGAEASVLELSALRAEELDTLLAALDGLGVEGQFEYVSFHVPSKFGRDEEARVVEALGQIVRRGWPLIVHPGVLYTPELWRPFGALLCIENMDSRSTQGRTSDELAEVFATYPEATFCLDLGHARQVDPSMVEAYRLLTELRPRLRQIHLSEVTSACRHARISYAARLSFQSVANLIPEQIPIVLESIVTNASEIGPEIEAARTALTPASGRRIAAAAE